jgi:hypothetical protein
MIGFQPSDTLRKHRPLLLACEAIGWLHMTGKANIDFLQEPVDVCDKVVVCQMIRCPGIVGHLHTTRAGIQFLFVDCVQVDIMAAVIQQAKDVFCEIIPTVSWMIRKWAIPIRRQQLGRMQFEVLRDFVAEILSDDLRHCLLRRVPPFVAYAYTAKNKNRLLLGCEITSGTTSLVQVVEMHGSFLL